MTTNTMSRFTKGARRKTPWSPRSKALSSYKLCSNSRPRTMTPLSTGEMTALNMSE